MVSEQQTTNVFAVSTQAERNIGKTHKVQIFAVTHSLHAKAEF